MLEAKVIELKKKISELYNLYLNSDNKKEYITKLGKMFNIPIFDVLANNYRIVSIDIDNLSIVIEDIRHNIIYNASYTSDLVNYKGNVIRFIEVTEIDSKKYLKRIYHIGDERPIISNMVFEKYGEVLEFIKEESHDENTFLDNGKKLTIRYLVNNDGNYVPLLTRMDKRNNEDSFERIYTYDGIDYNCDGILIDKSIYVEDGNMVYIVDDFATKTPLAYLKGICFENTQIDIDKYKVNGINLNTYESLANDKTNSAIIFRGVVEDELCLLEIYKNDECINIKYHKRNNVIESDNDFEVLFENTEFPILNKGKINVLEIDLIINELKRDLFINMVVNELTRFSKKIYIKDKMIEEEYDPLSPGLLLDKEFDIIADVVSKNEEGYMSFIRNEFNIIANINGKNK